MIKALAELTAEAKGCEESMMKVRQRIWRGEAVASRDVIDAAMRGADLCKLSSRAEKELNRDAINWLQQTRRSMRAMLREYWTDVLDRRLALYEPEIAADAAFSIPVR